MSKKISKYKSEIIGLLCAEGCHCKYVTVSTAFCKKRGKYYTSIYNKETIDFGNQNLKLLARFNNLLKKVYDYSRRVTGVPRALRIVIGKRSVMNDLLKYTDYGCEKWSVPKEIRKSDLITKATFVRGLYEGDGTKVYYTSKRSRKPYIDFHMKNGKGLKQVSNLLESIGINSHLRFNKKENMYRLIVKGDNVIKFRDIIKPKFKKIILTRNC